MFTEHAAFNPLLHQCRGKKCCVLVTSAGSMIVEMQYSHDALSRRRCANIEFHSMNFLIALAMKATPARCVENIIEPIPCGFLIRRRFFILGGNFEKQRYQWKNECPKGCKRIAKQFFSPMSVETRRLPIDRQTRIHGKSFKQDLRWAAPSTEPRSRCRIVKHAMQIVVVLRIEGPRRSIPVFG